MPEPTEPPHRRRSHTTARDLERYAGLFAERTQAMRSSAMRDLMAITARPEVISLAGGLPDTSTFPPQSYAAIMQQVAAESCAKALQYGPTDGMAAVKKCVRKVMAAEGTPVVAPVAAAVVARDYQAHGAGFYLTLDAADGRSFFFAHC